MNLTNSILSKQSFHMGDKYKHADGWTSDETFRSMRRNAEQYKKICKENIQLKEDLEFYKSIFQKQSNSAIVNLRNKTINGKRIWVDKVKIYTDYELLNSLDKDEEVIEWLKPIRCER